MAETISHSSCSGSGFATHRVYDGHTHASELRTENVGCLIMWQLSEASLNTFSCEALSSACLHGWFRMQTAQGGKVFQTTGAQPLLSPKESDLQNRCHRSSYHSNSTQRHFFPQATIRSSAGEQQPPLRQVFCGQSADARPSTTAGYGAHTGATAMARHQASNASCTLGAVFCCQDTNTRAEDALPASISPDNCSARAQRSASVSGTVLRVPADRQDGSCPHGLTNRTVSGVKRTCSDVSEPFSNSKKPRSLHLHGDDTDDGKLLQVSALVSIHC